MGQLSSLGESLKNARLQNNYTLREVEDLTGISNGYLSQVETNKIKKPSANVLYKLSRVYKIPFEELVKSAGIVEKSAETTEETGSPKTLAGFALWANSLTSDEEEELSRYLGYLRSKKNG